MRALVLAGLAIAAAVATAPVAAGVVVENEVTVADGKSSGTGRSTFFAQGEMARMDPHDARGKGDMSVIFRDQTMWFVDHDKKVSQKIDKKGVEEIGEQLDAVMKQFEQMPPEQREMMEKMMQGKMPGMAEPPPRRVEVGGLEQVGDYSCTLHTLYVDGKKTTEVCSAEESVAADVHEAMGAFRALSEFTEDLQKILQRGPVASLLASPYAAVDEMGGFPIRARQYDDDGVMIYESTLKSITRKELEPAVFTVPEGYKVKDLSKEMKKGMKR